MTRDDIEQLVTSVVTPTPGKTSQPRVTEVTARLLRDLLVAMEERTWANGTSSVS